MGRPGITRPARTFFFALGILFIPLTNVYNLPVMATRNNGAPQRGQKEKIIAIIGLLVLVVLAVVFFHPIKELTLQITRFLMDKDGARAYFEAHQPYSALYYMGLCVLQVVISPIPGELASFLAGMVFGWLKGFLYASIGLTVGSLINVTVGRIFQRVFLEKIIPARLLDSFEARANKYGLLTVWILFLFPGAPKDIFCYLFGLSRIPIWIFLLVSSVARMPGTLVLTLQGDQVFEGDWTAFIVTTVSAMVVLIPALIFKDRIMRRLGLAVDAGSTKEGKADA
jgi:uncharacterized membrane protein YdjX (TVP38/TMEM64 family)